jgi:hypothetical protein
MSIVQHEVARRLLPVIARAVREDRLLTYQTAAVAVGRDPKSNARMVAQVCDLLDAAAAYADVPLLALIAVRESGGHINRKAWRGADLPVELREKILQRSKSHRFTDGDFVAIERALTELAGYSNRAAWRRYYGAGQLSDMYRRLVGADELNDLASPVNDAIDDLGTDVALITPVIGMRYARDPAVRAAVLRRANGRCELCGEVGFRRLDGSHYLESHHIMALANEGPDRVTNVIALCANHHREAHFGQQRQGLERRMIVIVRRFGQVIS